MFKKIARLFWMVLGAIMTLAALVCGGAFVVLYDEESCKEWTEQHFGWKFKD